MPAAGKPTLVVFLGGLGDSAVEGLVGGARWAATLDSIDAGLGSGAYERAVLVTDRDPGETAVAGLAVDVDAGEFHFGRRLTGVIAEYGLSGVVYLGGGSVPLFEAPDFACIGEAVAGGAVVTNNRYSSDLVGFTVREGMTGVVEGLDRDNSLAPALIEIAGLTVDELPRSLGSLVDIDAPTDVAVLKLAGAGGARLRAYMDSLELDSEPYKSVLPLFLDRRKQIVVAGRVGSHTWQYLERETACRVRLFAEERGMEADGRAGAGTARSLLGYYLDSVGTPRFFETLAELGDGAFIDTRVLAAHAGASPSREDRFQSDLGRWRQISDPFLRDVTRGASEAPMPVLLGGHSLMSGALMLLNETAWRMRDEGRI